MKNLIQLFAISLAACLWAGCATRTITYGDATYKSRKLFSGEQFGGLEIVAPDGTKVKMDAYQSEQSQAVSAAVRAAIEASK